MTIGWLAYPGPWQREGRGLTAEIKGLSADAVVRAISLLPEAWTPYRLLAVTKRKEGKRYVEVVRVAEAGQLDERRSEDGHWNYFLWSPSLTPELIEPLETEYVDTRAAGVLSLNGLVNIQYRPQMKGQELTTDIGCVHKIRSEAGEVILHSEYEKIYRALVRELRKVPA